MEKIGCVPFQLIELLKCDEPNALVGTYDCVLVLVITTFMCIHSLEIKSPAPD